MIDRHSELVSGSFTRGNYEKIIFIFDIAYII